jgi:hypothetical protein
MLHKDYSDFTICEISKILYIYIYRLGWVGLSWVSLGKVGLGLGSVRLGLG